MALSWHDKLRSGPFPEPDRRFGYLDAPHLFPGIPPRWAELIHTQKISIVVRAFSVSLIYSSESIPALAPAQQHSLAVCRNC